MYRLLQEHMQHIWHAFIAIQQWQSVHTHEKHQRKQEQPRVLGWSQPGSTAAHFFFYGRLPACSLGAWWLFHAGWLTSSVRSQSSPPLNSSFITSLPSLLSATAQASSLQINLGSQHCSTEDRNGETDNIFAYVSVYLHLILYLTPD